MDKDSVFFLLLNPTKVVIQLFLNFKNFQSFVLSILQLQQKLYILIDTEN